MKQEEEVEEEVELQGQDGESVESKQLSYKDDLDDEGDLDQSKEVLLSCEQNTQSQLDLMEEGKI